MNKLIYLGILLSLSFGLFAQTSVPNGDLENWTTVTYQNPSGFPFTQNDEMARGGGSTFNITKTTDKNSGTYALQLETIKVGPDTLSAYVVNGQPTSDNPTTWKGSQPITGTPTGLTGFYKYNQATTDSVIVIVTFSKANAQIGMYMGRFGGLKSSYTTFNIPFTPALSMAPDSVTIAFSSSDEFKGIKTVGAVAKIDDISFTGIATQPTWLDGGFESWNTKNIDNAIDWYSEDGNVVKSTDKATGSYSAQLTTTLGSNKNNVPLARSARLSNGYYIDGCGENCTQLGGMPYSLKKDTLVFSYKYTPSGPDTAQVYFNFKKSGVVFDVRGQQLYASAGFSIAKIPYDLPQFPDTILISFESSTWRDSAVTFVGSTLIIDDIYFASDRSASKISNAKSIDISITPNPAKNNVDINIADIGIDQAIIKIYTLDGVLALSTEITSISSSIDVSSLINGTYILTFKSDKGVAAEKLIIKK